MSTTLAEATQSSHKVRREGDRVIIDGVHHPGWKYASSVHGARAVIMETLGESISYDELVGFDALAFRVQLMAFCPSSPHCSCGYDCSGRSLEAMPWEVKFHHVGPLKADNPEHAERIREARRDVMARIDRGVPVEYGDIEDGVIIGYQAGGDEWVCLHPMHDSAQKPHIEKGLTWGILIFTSPKQALPDVSALARKSLEQAVTMWSTPRAGDKDGYHLGEAAWKLWIEELAKPMDDQQAGKHQQGNAWTYDATAGYRRSAAAYLGKIAPLFDISAAEHLHRAAGLYEKMANEVLADPDHCITTIAPYPWTGPWTAEQRADQVRRMAQAMELDREAIAELQRAIAT
jgi:hypothetical protein